MKITFPTRLGYSEIEIPVAEQRPTFDKGGMVDLWESKVTIYNDIPADAVNDRHFDRFVIERCNIQGGIVSKADGTVENVVNAVTVITKDVDRYKAPLDYAALPVDVREEYYTVQVGDFIVFAEVYDEVTTSREFAELQNKYKGNGIVVRSVSPNIHGMSVDNITMANVG